MSPQSSRSAVRRLALSRFVSMAGTDATGVAIGFALYEQTRSATWLSLSLMLTVGASALFAPLAGWVGDRADRRRLMIGLELGAAVVFLVLAVVHTPIALLGLGVVATLLGTLFGPASGAAIAHVAGEEHLSWASSIIATGANVGKTAGRLVAGVLIAALGVSSVFVLDAVTFLASAALIWSVRRAFSAPRATAGVAAPSGPPAPSGVAAPSGAAASSGPPAPSGPAAPSGLALLRGDRTLRALVTTACVSTFATAFTMTAEVPLVFELDAGALGLGALTACWGGGMIAGSWLAGRALHAGNELTGVLVGRVTMAAGVALVAVAPALEAMLLCYLLGGLGGGFMGVATQSVLMRAVPDHLRARMLGTVDACRNVAFGLGVTGAGAAVAFAGARPVYALVGTAMALGTLPVAARVISLGGLRPLRPALAT